MQLEKDEKIIFECKPLSKAPLVFSDSDKIPTQMGGFGISAMYLTNKRLYAETRGLAQTILDLKLSDISDVKVKKFLFWKYLVVDSNTLLGVKPWGQTHRVWMAIGGDSEKWLAKIKELA